MKAEIFRNKKKQKIGRLWAGRYQKNVVRAKHFCRKHRAYGIDYAVFNQLVDRGAAFIDIMEKESGKIYSSSMELWQSEGIVDTLSIKHGTQIFLDIDKWTETSYDEVMNAIYS